MDTFFSGTSDVALPEGGGRRAPREPDRSETDLEARAPYFCERCDESIPLSELAAGRARLVYGLSFCVRCSPLIEEEKYQIYFCDRCEVSVPLERIEGGEALAGDGHVYCERCRRRPSRLARTGRRLALPSAIVLALLAVTAAAIGWPRAPRTAPPSFEREIDAARERLLDRFDADPLDRREATRRLIAELEQLEAGWARRESLLSRIDAMVDRTMEPREGAEPPQSTEPGRR